MENKKKIIIGILCALVAIMAVGYAILATELNIAGTASIDSTWKVEITNITEKDIVGDATSKVAPSYTATTANFSVGLIQPTDSITYDIEVSNLGTLDARVGSINVTFDENDAIIYKTEGLAKGDTLGVNEKDTLSLTVSYNPEVTSQPSVTAKEITVTINYIQDLGQSSSVTYDTYSIGDVVTFAGSNWYVIKNSTSEEDYVTLLKETVLTNVELGEYARNQTITCIADYVANGTYGCMLEGEQTTIKSNTMDYYWSDTCHSAGSYGYTDGDESGCDGHNDYDGSKVREYLEGTYINTLGADNLKEIEGYKIRVIDVKNDMDIGKVFLNPTPSGVNVLEEPNISGRLPNWIYEDFGDRINEVRGYWSMTSSDKPSQTYRVDCTAHLYSCSVILGGSGVRPVINLLKSSI